MNLQTKMNIVSVITGLIVIVCLSVFVIISNQKDANNEAAKETEAMIEEITSFSVSEEEYVTKGYIVVNKANIMDEPSNNGRVVGELLFNDMVEYSVVSNGWFQIRYNGNSAYINSSCVSDNKPSYKEFNVPNNKGFKSFMDYRSITDTSSPQYKLQRMYAYTGERGMRIVNGRYCVAVGSHFTSKIGQYFDIVLADGTFIPCILADQKSDAHTDGNNIITMHNGCVSEFVVDTPYLDSKVRAYGNVSFMNSWDEQVVQIRVYDKNVFDEE